MPRPARRLAFAVGGGGSVAAVAAVALDRAAAASAAGQDWAPFVLVAGLLLVGWVAAEDRVFDAAGALLARAAVGRVRLYAGSMALVAVVTAVLNLDTSVTFLTPLLVAAGRRLGGREGAVEAPLLYGCLLTSNAASLLLPGSNLTNLIVLGHLHLSGGTFAGRMAPAWIVSTLTTATVVALVHRRSLIGRRPPARRADATAGKPGRVRIGWLGLAATTLTTGLVVVLRSPAVPVFAVGVASALTWHFRHAPRRLRRAWARVATRDLLVGTLGVPVLLGLFGTAVGAGTLGRAWTGPESLLLHAGTWGGAAAGAVLSLVVNNLPAASLLAARHPPHPFALLVGLDNGPNLFVTGSLSSILWWQGANRAGSRPSIGEVTRLGALSAPAAMAGSLLLLSLAGFG